MKCICCNKSVRPHSNDKLNHEESVFKTETRQNGNTIRAENRMWMGGIVGNISAGYGSILDGDMFVVAICDDCIIDKVDEGIVAFTGNYMGFGDQYETKERVESLKKLWRRNNNLDELL